MLIEPSRNSEIQKISRYRTINRSFLEKLVGLPVHDAEQMITEAGFKPMSIKHGYMIAQMIQPDVIELWTDESNEIIYKANCSDTSQLVEDV